MKFPQLNLTFSSLALLLCSITANAGIISGTHYTNDGKLLALQGLEWLSLEHTAGMSRYDVEGGFTDRYGNTWQEGDWTYATRAQTETLLNSLWGGVYSGYSHDNFDGASWFIENFGGLGHDTGYGASRIDGKGNGSWWTNEDYSGFMFGENGDCSFSSENTCIGYIISADAYYQNINALHVESSQIQIGYQVSQFGLGFLHDNSGLNLGVSDYNHQTNKGVPYDIQGSLLVRQRPSSISEPSTLAIFTLTLVSLMLRRVKQRNKQNFI